jgi:hypothetical protein
MARASSNQHAFNAGELSKLLFGRQDIDKYARGLAVCFNAIPMAQGGWTRRPGMRYLHQARHHDKECRLFPFQYSVEQTYILEFGHNYIRFFTNHGILTEAAQSITSISKASTGKLTKNSHGYSDTNRLLLSPVAGMKQLHNREVVVTNKTSNDFDLYDSSGTAINTTNYDTFTSGSMAKIVEVTTTFTEAELPDIRVLQSADTLYIFHPDHKPQKLVRNSATSWTLSALTFVDGPYDSPNTTTTTMTPSAATGTVTLTASAVTGVNEGLGFQSGDVGRLMRLKEGSVWGYVEILTVGSTVSVTANVLSTLTNTNAKTTWRMGVWSDTTGWPTCGTFYDDRLFLAGAEAFPQRLDGSKTGSYMDFTPSLLADGTVAADNAVGFTLNSDDVNAIRWMASNEKGLLVGTSRGEWQVKPSALNEAITPTNISAKPSTRHGSADVAPVNASRAVLFVQRAQRKIRELAYVFESDGFKAPDRTLLAEHVTRGGITELAYQEQPQGILWGLRADGIVTGMTYERDQDVVAWHRHELGGWSNAGHTAAPIVESIAAVPAPDGTRDELYVVVQRYINGGTKRYIEYSSKMWEQDDTQADAFYVDGGITVTNSPASATVEGLWAWEGETLNTYVDGARHIDVTVSNGKVTLERTGTTISLGYFYNSDGQTLPIEGGTPDGSAQGKTKRIHKVGFWLVDTLGFKFGRDADNLYELLVRQWGDTYGEPTTLYTGVVRERFEGEYNLEGQVYWRADGPFPATVLSIMPQFEVSDDS